MAAPTIASGNKKYTAQPVRRGAHNRAPAMRRRGHPKPHCQSESKGAQRHLSPRTAMRQRARPANDER